MTRHAMVANEHDIRATCTSPAGRLAAALVMLLPALTSGLEAQDGKGRVNGVQVRVIDNAGGDRRGELLGWKDESLWILEGEREARSFISRPLADLKEVRMQRHGWSGGRIALWTGLAGGATTVAMYGACASFEENSGDCGVVAVAWAGAWAVIGGLTRLLIGSSWKSVRPPDLDDLRPYARFPQGVPEGYPPRIDDRVPPSGHAVRLNRRP